MNIQRTLAALILVLVLVESRTKAADWITSPSFYTHNPRTGKRVYQYRRKGPFYYPPSFGARRRGYRHIRRSVQVGTSADHYHVVEEFGGPVRPYGEWRYPYRPYSVPYDHWGPPVPIYGVPPFGFYPPTVGNGNAGGFQGSRAFGQPPRRGPWQNGNYRPFPPRRNRGPGQGQGQGQGGP